MAKTSINDFISSISKSGVVKNNRYLVSMRPPGYVSSSFDSKLLTIRCDSARMPGMSFASADGPPRYGYGPTERIPYVSVFDEISLTFTIDANSTIHKFFNSWVNSIFNFNGQGSTQIKQKGVYEVGYKKYYSTDITIEVYSDYLNSDSVPTMTCIAYEAFPMAFPSESLSWGDGQPIKLTIPFAYTNYEMKYSK